VKIFENIFSPLYPLLEKVEQNSNKEIPIKKFIKETIKKQ
jgi:hypothetical protein